MESKLAMFLRERDRARARGDFGVDRSLTADLRRYNVPDDATLAHPSGLPRRAATAVVDAPEESRKSGRPKLPRCEHGQVADRCSECNEDLAAS